MKNPLLTVVMPVYNASDTINASIGSLLKQTCRDWRLICVNDGSTDNSLEILERFAAEDSRITVLSQENGGAACARRTAYRILDSEYVLNLDADDHISSDFIEKCCETIVVSSPDIIVPNCINETMSGRSMNWFEAYGYIPGQSMTGIQAISRTFTPSTLHGHLVWKSSLIKEYACPASDEFIHLFCEDEFFWRILFLKANSVLFVDCCYYYKCNFTGLTKSFKANHIDYLTVCEQLLAYDGMPEDVLALVYEYYFRVVVNLKIKLYAYGDRALSESEYEKVRLAVKTAYKKCVAQRKHIHFLDKQHPVVYRMASLSGYGFFCLTCFIMARKKF